MFNKLFAWFENRVNPYPESPPKTPSSRLLPFIWQATHGMRFYLLLVIFFNIIIGIIDATLFQYIGEIVDWIATLSPSQLWAETGIRCCLWHFWRFSGL